MSAPSGEGPRPGRKEGSDRLLIRISARFYSTLVLLLPPSLRSGSEEELVDTFVDLCRDARRDRGVIGIAGMWWRAVVAVLGDAIGARREERRHSHSAPRPERSVASALETSCYQLRQAVRTLARHRGFSTTVILILAIGIGATTTIFSVVDGLVLKGIDAPEADRLVYFDQGSHTVPEYLEWKSSVLTVETLVGIHAESRDLSGIGNPERVRVSSVTPEYFSLLGTAPHHGRLVDQSDIDLERKVAVLAYHLWAGRFGADSAVVGRVARLNGEPHEIIGVMRPGFRPPVRLNVGNVDIWTPLILAPEQLSDAYSSYLRVFGKLQDGATITGVQGEVDRSIIELEARYPEEYATYGSRGRFVPISTLHRAEVVTHQAPVLTLFGAVSFMLLIACTTVASLFLAWVRERAPEVRLRVALGASRRWLVSQLLTESVLLSGIGGFIGVGLAYVGVSALVGAVAVDLPGIATPQVDGRVLFFATLLVTATGVGFGFVPAALSARLGMGPVSGRIGTRVVGTGARFGTALVTTEVALSLVLLIGAGLLFRSLFGLMSVDPGFEPEGAYAVNLGIEAGHPDIEQRRQFSQRLLERFAEMPQIRSAAASAIVPFMESGFCCRRATLVREEVGDSVRVAFHPVTPGFLETLRAPLRQGADLPGTAASDGVVPLVATVSTASRLFPAGDALGNTLSVRIDGGVVGHIVGVVEDFKFFSLERDGFTVFAPFDPYGLLYGHQQYVLRTEGENEALAGAIKEAIQSIDPALPVPQIASLAEQVDLSLLESRLLTGAFTAFATFALILALGGIYGTTAYTVARRKQELGVRLALGADPRRLVRSVLLRGVRSTVIGMGFGLFGAIGLSALLSSFVFGITAQDPPTFLGVTLLMGSVATLATYAPARRAASVDPLETLSSD